MGSRLETTPTINIFDDDDEQSAGPWDFPSAGRDVHDYDEPEDGWESLYTEEEKNDPAIYTTANMGQLLLASIIHIITYKIQLYLSALVKE